MVGVEMRDDQRTQALLLERAAQHRLPSVLALVRAQTRVERRPTVLGLDQIDVHVIQAVRQRQPQPANTGGDID